ncbi:hypothetical protein DPEC_G00074080 [Dallia pectoralis]|uniref:Uncharacterized protein n=1 Tax=Dallia pectoralis TaxID=75939 RepID=A0ACC2H4A4_DALPE|nr:hypothetical protein DPEC_G00074080 [Dallia pectoralis]
MRRVVGASYPSEAACLGSPAVPCPGSRLAFRPTGISTKANSRVALRSESTPPPSKALDFKRSPSLLSLEEEIGMKGMQAPRSTCLL